MTVLEECGKIRDLIKNEENWCQGENFRDIDNLVVLNGDKAVKFCLIGALYKTGNWEDRYNIICYLERFTGRNMLSIFNDTHQHKEVIEMLDKAISTAQINNL